MQKLINFTGTIVLIALGGYSVYYLYQNFQNIVSNILSVIGAFALIFILVRLFYGKNSIFNLGKELFIGSDLILATKNFLNELPKPKTEVTANFAGHLIYRFTRLGMIGLLLSIIPIWLLFNQNRLTEGQTKLLEKQTIRLDQQTYLQEAERRSSLMFSFSNIMDAVDTELKADIGEKKVRDLSPQLVGRIIALCSSLKPYRFLDGDTLINKPLSPERGQLLVALIKSKLDSITIVKLLEEMDLSGADLREVNLKGALLIRANLVGANLNGAILHDANMRGANLDLAQLIRASLFDTNLLGAELNGTDLSHSRLMGANLDGAQIFGSNFSQADLIGAKLNNAYFVGTSLKGAYLVDAILDNTLLSETNLTDAILEGADFTNTRFCSKSLQDVLGNIHVDFLADYKVDTIISSSGDTYYSLV